jgi:hypothetical protein
MSSPQSDKNFGGSIAKFYNEYIVPLIFEPYAEVLAQQSGADLRKGVRALCYYGHLGTGSRPCMILPRTGREKNVLIIRLVENGTWRFHGMSDRVRANMQ